jgi:hypothetical protein
MKKFLLVLVSVFLSFQAFSQFTGTNKTINSGDIRFGDGAQLSVNTTGNLLQPFYRNGTTWRPLTFSNYALDYAFAVGGIGASEWNTEGTYAENPTMSSQVFDDNGFIITSGQIGYGTLKVKGNITIGNITFEVINTYEVGTDDNYISVTTSIKNTSSSLTATNLRFWIGTRDDWVGSTDRPTKTRGNLVNGAFARLTATTERSSALLIKTGDEGVLFFTNSTRANNAHSSYGRFTNSTYLNPASAAIETTNDGSYAMFVRMNDLAPGQSDEFKWFYAAATLTELNQVIADVAQASSSVSNITDISATLTGRSNLTGTGYFVVVPRGSTAPTAAQIEAGVNYSSVVVVNAGSSSVTAEVSKTFNLTGLSPGTDYDVYFVAKGTLNNDPNSYSPITQASFSTNRLSQTITFPEIASKTYGDQPFTLGESTSSAGLSVVYTSSDATILSVSGNQATILKAGTVTVTANQAGSSLYSPAPSVARSLTIARKTLTITATAGQGKIVGAPNPTLTYTASGFVNNDQPSVLTGALSRSAGETIGNYPISIGTLAAVNYTAVLDGNPTFTIRSSNQAPTDIGLSASTIAENVAANSAVGTLSTTDVDAGNTFTYTL